MKSNSIFKTAAGEKEIMSLYDSILNKWPVPYETKVLPTRHGDTFAIVCGKKKAPALILLHGAASNATSWIGDVAEYGKLFRVYALDIPGDPGKSAQNRPSWQGLGYAEWLYDVLKALKLKKASLLGMSQGGWTALRYATRYPERVEKLVLLSPGGIAPARISFVIKAVLLSFLGRAGAKKINRIAFGKQPVHPKAVKYMDLIMPHFKVKIEKGYIFTDDELNKLKMPVLLIGGTEDAIRSSEAIISRMSKHVPRLTSIIIPGMGHVLVNLTQHIIPFLKDRKGP